MTEERPDPDKLLKRIQAEESRRGKLKIFFGAVAGVGKTYAMLEAARHRQKEKVDVVVGYVETHKRAETEALLEGLDVLPRKMVAYKNAMLPEFDIDAALKRNPSLILVDELAHTNASGSCHMKRWQDVEDLLAAGIDVYTTLNVQHCESVNDVVAQVTGVVVRETVPDTFVEKADEIELVDLPAEDLLKRLKEGKVYLGAQAERAAENFFQPGNLIALRQLALRYTAKNVDVQMRNFKERHSISTIWNVGERFLVCISASPAAMRLIRAAKRIASEIGAPWTVAYVETPAALRRTAKNLSQVSEMMRFAEKLGAEIVTLSGPNVSDELISFARSKNITKLIVGKPARTRWQELVSGSIINELARKCGEIDIYVISGERQQTQTAGMPGFSKAFSWKGMLWAAGIVLAITGVNNILFGYVKISNLILIYLAGIVVIAFRFGRRVSFVASLLSVLLFDFLFVPPRFSFTVSDSEDLITFGIMFAVGLFISMLTERLRAQTLATRIREERTRVLYELNRDFAKLADPDELFRTAVFHIRDHFRIPAAIYTPDPKKKLAVRAGDPEGRDLNPNEAAVIQWVFDHKEAAGKNTETLQGAQGFYLPIQTSEKTVGVLGVYPEDEVFFSNPEQRHLLEMFANQTALAVEGAELSLSSIKAENDIEKERFRNLLLSTFSYELPGPLSEIARAASELLERGSPEDSAKRNLLSRKIRDKAQDLNKLVEELPKIIEAKE